MTKQEPWGLGFENSQALAYQQPSPLLSKEAHSTQAPKGWSRLKVLKVPGKKKNRFAESMMKTRRKSTMVFKPTNADLCNGRDRYTEKGISLVEDD